MTSIAIAPVGDSSSRAVAAPLAPEGRGLKLVARGMAVELEAERFGRLLQPVEMLVEVGDPLFGIEAHHFFKVRAGLLAHR